MEEINHLDTNVFLWLNGKHTNWLDPVMYWLSDRDFWFPFYGILIAWLVWMYRKQALGVLLTVVGALVFADQFTSSVLKPLTHRLRPCHEPTIDRMVHVVWECGGSFGFASSHAANAFAFAVTFTLLIGNKVRWIRYLFIWAMLVSYSRIYVGAHYPLDVLTGAGVGTIGAIFVVAIYRFIHRRFDLHSV